MSLVLLSNDNNTAEFEGGGISQANTWTNVLQTPMIIPKNAEVALQSLRVNKAATTAIDFSNNKFYTYIGQGRSSTGFDDLSKDTRMVAPAILVDGDYTAQSFVDNSLLPALREAIFHPDYQDRVNASVQETATGDFEGYNIKFGEGSTPPSDVFPADDEFVAAGRYNGFVTDNFTWKNSNKRFTKKDNLTGIRAYGIATRYPMSVRQAKHVAEFSNAGANQWAIGLSRYADGAKELDGRPKGYFAIPDWARETLGDWYDFGVIRDADDKLRIYHAVVKENSDRTLVMDEVEYYGYTGALVTEPYDLGTNASGYDRVEFLLDGEQVNIYMINSGTAARDLFCSPDLGTPDKENYLKPINISCQYLYPKYEVVENNGYITMINHEGVDVQNFKYDGLNDDDTLTYQDFYATAKSGFAGQSENNNKLENIHYQCRQADVFSIYNNFDDGFDTEHTFQKYSVSLPKIALIVGPDTVYYKPSNRANAANVLGFKGETVVDNPTQTGGFKTFTSLNTPENLVRNSMFCRLTSLTQKSSNGYTGNESKILYHCPRFDAAGRDSGELYYEPSEKTYLDISNPNDIQVNSFSIDFVTRDERLVNGMMGNSTVMLHIREKK